MDPKHEAVSTGGCCLWLTTIGRGCFRSLLKRLESILSTLECASCFSRGLLGSSPPRGPLSLSFPPSLPLGIDPRSIVLGNIELLEFGPCSNCVSACRPFIGRQELGNEVDVAAVTDPLESFHVVQKDILTDEIAVSRMIPARDLFLSPAV